MKGVGVAASTRTAVHSTTERVRTLPFPLATFLWSRALVWPTVPRVSRAGLDRDTTRRDRVIVAASSLFLGVAVVEWSVGRWVS